jgi:hypothetical protein
LSLRNSLPLPQKITDKREGVEVDSKLLLCKAITLLYRESLLPDRADSSAELVRTVIDSIKVSDVGLGINSDREVIVALKATALEMCTVPQDQAYNRADLMQRIRLNCGNDERTYDAIRQGIEADIADASLKRSVVNIRNTINNHFKEETVGNLLSAASMKYKFERESIKDINQFIAELVAQLEPMHINGGGKDPALMDEIDIGNTESLSNAFQAARENASGDRVYKTGWQDLNDALQGGIRVETTVIGALQHKYKTGFSLSMFAQIAQYNTPHTADTTKKPLLLRISCEDSVVDNLQFLYQYLKYDETHEPVSLKDVEGLTVEDLAKYVQERLQATGFHVKMLRIDPTQWTYKSICNKVIEYEAQGYAVEVLMMDYLYKIPRTGCISTGPTGSDVMDQLSRVRNFCAGKKIAFITPHQISTEAKSLIRGGTPEDQFVKEIAERGYWEGTKGLDRVYDLCILIHLFKSGKETYLSVLREKHRIPTIVDEDKKYFLFKFPYKMPIPSDLRGEKISFRRLKSAPSNASEELFA